MNRNHKVLVLLAIVCFSVPFKARFILVKVKDGIVGHRNQGPAFEDPLNRNVSDDKDLLLDQIQSRGIPCGADSDCRACCPEEPVCSPSKGHCRPQKGCFWGLNMVHLKNGKEKTISDVKVGDSVLAVDQSGKLQFSQVIMHLHKDPDATMRFHVIRTNSGRNLTLTAKHLIYKAENNKPDLKFDDASPFQSRFAENIKKGDIVFVFDKNGVMMKDEVVSNDIVSRKGFYSPVTYHGNIIVEDILASCYADLENHSFLHMAFAPARWLNDARNALSSTENVEKDESFERDQDVDGLHWYPEALLAIGENIVPEKLEF